MKFNHFARALPVLALGCTLIAGPALAQTMAPVSAAPTAPSAPSAAQGGAMSMSKPAATAKPMKTATTTHTPGLPSADKFKTAGAATAHCPSDTVVWSTSGSSKVFHTSTSKYYGKTKSGAFVCEKDATAAGYHGAKN